MKHGAVIIRAALWSVVVASFLPSESQSVRFSPSFPGRRKHKTLSPETFEDGDFSGDVISGTTDAIENSGEDPVSAVESIVHSKIDTDTVDSVINETKKILEETRDLGAQEVIQTVSIIERATQLPSIPRQTAGKILEVVDTLSTLNVTGLDQAKTGGNFSNRLIRSIEELGEKVVLDNSSSARIVSATTAVEIWDISRASVEDALPLGLYMKVAEPEKEEEEEDYEQESGGPADGLNPDDLDIVGENDDVTPEDTDVGITLPSSFLRTIIEDNPGQETRLWMTVFSDTSLFDQDEGQDLVTSDPSETPDPSVTSEPERQQKSHQPRARLNSKVISASVSVNGAHVTRFPSSVVTSVFLPVQKVPDEERAQVSRCVFWDLTGKEGRGTWSEEGCHYRGTQHGRDVCVCDHLTNFAVLLDLYGEPSKNHGEILSLMTVVGLCLSIAGLTCNVLCFVCIKKMHSLLPKQVIFSLSLAMLLSWVIFLAGFSRASGSDVGCIAVAALLHYFILATFLWMLAEGIMQYLLLVKVHGHIRRFLLKASLAAWGIPAVPVVTILAVDRKLYRGYDSYCWMSLKPLYFSFLLPVALVMLCNLIIYLLVVISICRVRARARSGNSSNVAKNRGVSVRASIACFVVLGLSWILAFLAVEDARLVFQYLFTASTSLQGLLLFLLFTARDPLVQDFWRDKLRRGMALVRSTSRGGSGTGSSFTGGRGREEGGVHAASQESGKEKGCGGSGGGGGGGGGDGDGDRSRGGGDVDGGSGGVGGGASGQILIVRL